MIRLVVVTNEIKELNDNIPVVYTDKDGKVLVKKDGKFYKVDKDGKPSDEEVLADKVFVFCKRRR